MRLGPVALFHAGHPVYGGVDRALGILAVRVAGGIALTLLRAGVGAGVECWQRAVDPLAAAGVRQQATFCGRWQCKGWRAIVARRPGLTLAMTAGAMGVGWPRWAGWAAMCLLHFHFGWQRCCWLPVSLVLTASALAALERRQELGLLAALGARRGRVRRLILLENGIVAVAGGALARPWRLCCGGLSGLARPRLPGWPWLSLRCWTCWLLASAWIGRCRCCG